MGEIVVEFDYMKYDEVVTHVVANVKEGKFDFVNYTDDKIDKAFGYRETITEKDFNDFLEYRCFPKERANCKDILKGLGLEKVGYNPLSIVRITHGVMVHDRYWIRFKGEENLVYEEVRKSLGL